MGECIISRRGGAGGVDVSKTRSEAMSDIQSFNGFYNMIVLNSFNPAIIFVEGVNNSNIKYLYVLYYGSGTLALIRRSNTLVEFQLTKSAEGLPVIQIKKVSSGTWEFKDISINVFGQN